MPSSRTSFDGQTIQENITVSSGLAFTAWLVWIALGSGLGGRWADRRPRPETLYAITTVAAFLVGLIPLIAAPILNRHAEVVGDPAGAQIPGDHP